jgi:hypothetical protein
MTARSTDPSTWTEQEQADLVTALRRITEGINAATESLNAAFGSIAAAVAAVEAAQATDPEEFCPRCLAGTTSDEHHGKCVTTGYAIDDQPTTTEETES